MLKRIQRFFDEHLQPQAGTTAKSAEHGLRLATAALLLEIARSDYEQHPQEIEHIRELLRERFAISEAECDELCSMAEAETHHSASLHPFTQLINQHYGADQKREVVESLWQVAYADGRLDKYEEHLLRRIADLIHVPHKVFIQTKLRVAESMPSAGEQG